MPACDKSYRITSSVKWRQDFMLSLVPCIDYPNNDSISKTLVTWATTKRDWFLLMWSETASKVIKVHKISFAHGIYAKLKAPEDEDLLSLSFHFTWCAKLFHLNILLYLSVLNKLLYCFPNGIYFQLRENSSELYIRFSFTFNTCMSKPVLSLVVDFGDFNAFLCLWK